MLLLVMSVAMKRHCFHSSVFETIVIHLLFPVSGFLFSLFFLSFPFFILSSRFIFIVDCFSLLLFSPSLTLFLSLYFFGFPFGQRTLLGEAKSAFALLTDKRKMERDVRSFTQAATLFSK